MTSSWDGTQILIQSVHQLRSSRRQRLHWRRAIADQETIRHTAAGLDQRLRSASNLEWHGSVAANQLLINDVVADSDHHLLKLSGEGEKCGASQKHIDKAYAINVTVAGSDRHPLKTEDRGDTEKNIEMNFDHIHRPEMSVMQAWITGPSAAALITCDGNDKKIVHPRQNPRHAAIYEHVEGGIRANRQQMIGTVEMRTAEADHMHDLAKSAATKGIMLADHIYDCTIAVVVAKADSMNDDTTATLAADEAVAADRAADVDM